MTVGLKTRACLKAALDLSSEDSERFIDLHDAYLAGGMDGVTAATAAAADLLNELNAEAQQINDAISALDAKKEEPKVEKKEEPRSKAKNNAKKKGEPRDERQPTEAEFGEFRRLEMLRDLKKAGGVLLKDAPDITDESRRRSIRMAPALFTKRGMGVDGLAQWMQERGYLLGEDALDGLIAGEQARAILRDAIYRKGVFKLADLDDVAEMRLAERLARDADMTAEEVELVLDRLADDTTLDEVVEMFDAEPVLTAQGITDPAIIEAVMERAAMRASRELTYEQAIREEAAAEQARTGRAGDRGDPAGESGARAAVEAVADDDRGSRAESEGFGTRVGRLKVQRDSFKYAIENPSEYKHYPPEIFAAMPGLLAEIEAEIAFQRANTAALKRENEAVLENPTPESLAAKDARAADTDLADRERADREVDAFALTPPTGEREQGATQQGDIFTVQGEPTETTKQTISDVGEKIGGARKDTATVSGKAAPKEPKDDRAGWRKRYNVAEIGVGDGKGRWTITDTRKTDYMGRPQQVGGHNKTFETQEEAEAAVTFAEVARNHTARMRGTGNQYQIWRNISDRKTVQVVAQEFATREDAMRYMAEHAVEIIETKTSFGEEILPRPDKVRREGPLRRSELVQRVVDSAKRDAKLVRDALVRHAAAAQNAGAFDIPSASALAPSPEGVNSALQESAAYKAAIFTELLGNLNDGGALSVEGFSRLDVPSKRLVLAAVIGATENAQVRRRIVQSVPVDVVDILSRKQRSPEQLFGDKTMLGDLLAVNDDPSVATPNAGAVDLVGAVARMAAKGSLEDSTRRAIEADPAVLTGQWDAIFDVRGRHGLDVTANDFLTSYSFRAVEFGNWEAQDERQTVMNHAYDALMDLADVMGVPAKALGLNGELALAFGARGHGLSGARAHYETDYGVINLTKMQGAGTLAHEWFHALDHYFARQDGKSPRERKANQRGDQVFDTKGTDSAERDMASYGFGRESGVREALRASYTSLIQTMFTKAEQYVEDTTKADKFVQETRNDLDQRLQGLRDNLSKPYPYGKKQAPASAEQLARFDEVVAKILAGEYLELEWKPGANTKSKFGGYRWSNDGLEALSAINKAVRGRTGFDATNQSGVMDKLAGAMKRYGARLKMLADAKQETTKERKVPTAFAIEAKRIDQGRASNYWATQHEMAARAFQAYVEDKVAERGGVSDFLSYGTNTVIPTPWGWALPFPQGNERTSINAAFDSLVQIMRVRETERGMRLESEVSQALPYFQDKYAGSAPAEQAFAEARAELEAWGVVIPEDVKFEYVEDASKPDTPMFVYADQRTISYNRAAYHDHAEDVETFIEEILHAIDVRGNGYMLSASMQRLGDNGDIRAELNEARRRTTNDKLQLFLRYPLGPRKSNLSEHRVAAELYARGAILYIAHPDWLAQEAPNTYRAFDDLYGRTRRRRSGVLREISDGRRGIGDMERGVQTPVPPVGAAAAGDDNGASTFGDASSVSGSGDQQSTNQLAEFIRDSADTFGGNSAGAPAKFGSRYLERDRTPDDPVLTEARRRAGLSIDRRSLADRIAGRVGSIWDKVRVGLSKEAIEQGIANPFMRIDTLEQRTLGNLPTEQRAYVSARQSTGAASLMRAIMLHGAPVRKDGVIQKVEGTQGVLDMFAPVKQDFDDWAGWMVGKRAQVLKAQGRENNLDDEHIAALLKLGKGKEERFIAVAREFAAFKRHILDLAEDSGLIDATTRPMWDQADWIPFYRAMADDRAAGPGSKKGLAGQSSGIRALKGGAEALNDPLENILMNFSHLLDASMKNHAMLQAIDNLQGALDENGEQIITQQPFDRSKSLVAMSELKRIMRDNGLNENAMQSMPPEAWQGLQKVWTMSPPADPDVVRVMRNGKPEYYRIGDRLLLRSLTAVTAGSPYGAFDPIMKVMRGFKRTLTRGVTATLDFLARNFIRDTMQAHMIVKDRMIPIAASAKGAWESYTETGGAVDMMFAGSSFLGGYVNGNDPTEMAEATRRALRRKGWNALAIGDFMSTIVDTPVKLWEAWERIGNSVENANRTAVYEAAIRAGKSKATAAFESKDLMDFSQRGDWVIMQLLADTLPFFNARVQGMYKLARAASADGKNPGVAIGRHLVNYVAVRGLLFITLPTLALMAANDGEEWYEELEEWDKDTYWHFKLQGQHYRIPKPFELGVIFATFPERIYRRISGTDDTKTLMKQAMWNIRTQLAIDPVAQTFRPLLEAFANESLFTGRPIEGEADQGELPHTRYSERTSSTARAIAEIMPGAVDATGLSPKMMEHFVRGYLGELGMYTLNLADLAVDALTDAPARPSLRKDQIPLLKSFVRDEPPLSTKWKTELYDMHREASQIFRSINDLRTRERDDQADKLEDEHADKLDMRKELGKATKELSQISKEQDAIMRDRTLTPREKREQIDELMRESAELSREVAQDVREPFRR